MARKVFPPPFSLRLTFEERARLERDAAGTPLGAYMRQRLLEDSSAAPPRRRHQFPVKDRQALLQALGLLGQSRLANNLNQLAKAANLGTLPVGPDTEADLQEAVRDVAMIREAILKAIGLERGHP